jgi:hypothetical protein
MTDWPSDVPFFELRDGFGHTAADNVLRTPMDSGPAKARRRTTSAPQVVTGAARMTRAQYRAAKTFIDGTLKGGALSFTACDPVSGEDQTYRLTAPLSLSPMGLGWRVTASLEILP